MRSCAQPVLKLRLCPVMEMTGKTPRSWGNALERPAVLYFVCPNKL